MAESEQRAEDALKQDALKQRCRQALDASVEQLDGASLSRLNQARQQALDIHRQPSGRLAGLFPPGAMRVAGVAAVALLAVTLLWQNGAWRTGANENLPLAQAPAPISSDALAAEVLAEGFPVDAEELALAEDLEFIAWLLEQENDEG